MPTITTKDGTDIYYRAGWLRSHNGKRAKIS
jgi:hypothetical protein